MVFDILGLTEDEKEISIFGSLYEIVVIASKVCCSNAEVNP
jgi:hypothetical protein